LGEPACGTGSGVSVATRGTYADTPSIVPTTPGTRCGRSTASGISEPRFCSSKRARSIQRSHGLPAAATTQSNVSSPAPAAGPFGSVMPTIDSGCSVDTPMRPTSSDSSSGRSSRLTVGVMGRVRRSPSRSMVKRSVRPACGFTMRDSSWKVSTSSPSMATMRSPGSSLPSAGSPGITSPMRAGASLVVPRNTKK
jgi:hypothetical protein